MQTGELENNLGVTGTLLQMVKVLGFHDLSSFFTVAVFVLVGVSFLVAVLIAIIKKRRENRETVAKIVEEVQKEQISHLPEARPIEKDIPKIKEEELSVLPSVPTPIEFEKKPPEVTLEHPAKTIGAEPLPEVLPKTAPTEAKEPEVKTDLGAALKPTRQGFMSKLAQFFSRGAQISDEDFEEIEAILFTADIGAKTAQKLLDAMRERVKAEKHADKAFLRNVLKEEMQTILQNTNSEQPSFDKPQVIMFVGVNGAGKTTSIGKLGAKLKKLNKSVVFGAGDTFRAAAVEQLSIWGERISAPVVKGKEGQDSASVLFEAIEVGKTNDADYVLLDTAGRLHTKTSLMDELKKVHRVAGKAKAGAPHEVYLVVDATMGQNAIVQAREFLAATPLTGIILSKLDGTAKGGVALGIVDELKIPIRYIGIGEKESDLREFDAKLFIDALFDEV